MSAEMHSYVDYAPNDEPQAVRERGSRYTTSSRPEELHRSPRKYSSGGVPLPTGYKSTMHSCPSWRSVRCSRAADAAASTSLSPDLRGSYKASCIAFKMSPTVSASVPQTVFRNGPRRGAVKRRMQDDVLAPNASWPERWAGRPRGACAVRTSQ